ncbi:hypothetical protein [Polynucleobacter ibericus]|uniref:bestrophin-like domain n=1 Tax=Polynucleobacter ibericus TaxID=1819725 RepID=UPI00203D283F|nr:hypothetical protein [Polynucleobacter ibericus]
MDLGIIQTATLTLLALIIGFTFSMAIDRHDQREIFEEGEANAIGTEYLRADLLPSNTAAATKELLIQYIDQRILFYSQQSPEKIQEIRDKTDQLQTALWKEILPTVRTQATPAIALVASGMNDVINSQGYVQAAWWNRIPFTAWVLMAAIAICANLLVGFGARNFEKNTGLFMIFPFVISVSFFLIADIDSPRGGVIRIEARNLVALKNNLTQQMDASAPSFSKK